MDEYSTKKKSLIDGSAFFPRNCSVGGRGSISKEKCWGGGVALANLVGGGGRGSEKKSPDLKSAEVGISVF